MNENWYVSGFVLGILLFLLATVGAIAWLGNHAAIPAQMAEIESLRRDAATVDATRAEDVIGQVTQWNQTIASNRAFNQTWYAGWSIPDEWDRIPLIEIPAAPR